MEQYESDFIQLSLDQGVFMTGDFTLKSGRKCSFFFNAGSFSTGGALCHMGNAYANALLSSGLEFDSLYGVPEKGSRIVVATAMELSNLGKEVPCFHTRKELKFHGDATRGNLLEQLVVGSSPNENDRIATVDDVMTTGQTKYEVRELLEKAGNFQFPVLAIALDRQEVGAEGVSAIDEYEKRTGTKVQPIITLADVYNYLDERVPLETPHCKITRADLDRIKGYSAEFGTDPVKESLGV